MNRRNYPLRKMTRKKRKARMITLTPHVGPYCTGRMFRFVTFIEPSSVELLKQEAEQRAKENPNWIEEFFKS